MTTLTYAQYLLGSLSLLVIGVALGMLIEDTRRHRARRRIDARVGR